MTRHLIALLALAALAACTAPDTRAGSTRVTLMTSTTVIGGEFAADGRLAYMKYVNGKAAIYVTKSDSSGERRVSFGVWDWEPRWSPDGTMIAFNRDAGGSNDVVIVPSDSGAERIVASTREDEQWGDWLADGSGLVFMRGGEKGTSAWVYTIADGSTTKLFDADGSVNAFPSRDGKWVAYSLAKNGKSAIWLWDWEKHTHRQLTTEGFENIRYGCFSPDGLSVLYESRRTGTLDLWRVDIATGTRQQLTQDVADDSSGRWSPDGSRIVFVSSRGGQPDLWALSTGETDIQRVTDDAFGESMPVWTPDGHGVVARVERGHRHLYAFPVDGAPPTPLTSGDWDVDGFATVSRDGTRIAYASTRNGDADIWTVPTGGGESRLVSGAPGYEGFPSWSPDGKRVAFTSARSGNLDIWIAAADGAGTAARFTDWATTEDYPRWSPDGNVIAFRSNRGAAGFDIWTMPAAGGQPRRLTNLGTVDAAYHWAADGKSIAFSAQTAAAGGQVVLAVSASGGAPRQVAPPASRNPHWSPDGSQISLSQCNAGYCTIDIRSADGTQVKTLNPKPAVYEYGNVWSADGAWLLVGFENLAGDGRENMELRSTTGAPARLLAAPPGFSIGPHAFASGDKVAIASGFPGFATLQRIAVPAPIKSP